VNVASIPRRRTELARWLRDLSKTALRCTRLQQPYVPLGPFEWICEVLLAGGSGGGVGAHEDADAAGDDAVGGGVGEVNGTHHGLVVDLTEGQCGQVLGR